MRVLCSWAGGNEARSHLPQRMRASATHDPLPQERKLTSAALGEAGDLGKVLVRVTQTEKDKRGPNQTESNRIKPVWWQSSGNEITAKRLRKRRSYCGWARYARFRGFGLGLAKSSRIKVNQTKSNLRRESSKFQVQGPSLESRSRNAVSGRRTMAEYGLVKPSQTSLALVLPQTIQS